LVHRDKSGFSIPIRNLFANSKYLKEDLERSISYFKINNSMIYDQIPNKNIDQLIKNSPYLAYTIISLYYCLK
jgi:hypothetical protein